MESTGQDNDDVQSDKGGPTDDEYVPDSETTSAGGSSPLRLKAGFTLAPQTPPIEGNASKETQDLLLQQANIARRIVEQNKKDKLGWVADPDRSWVALGLFLIPGYRSWVSPASPWRADKENVCTPFSILFF